MYKMFVTDLDDTLLTSDTTISTKNKEALKYMWDKGIKIVLASGRGTPSMKKYVRELREYGIGIDHIISYNGALEVETSTYEIIDKRIVNVEICIEVIEFARAENIVIQVYVDETVYVEKINSYVERYMMIDAVEVVQVDDLIKIVEEGNGSYKLLLNDENHRLKSIKKVLEEKYTGKLDIFFSKDYYLELVNIETNKGLALKRLSSRVGISMEQVIAVGDAQNDKAMIEFAGVGCLMSNGDQSIEKSAKYITQNDHNNSAIAEIVYKFIE